MKGRVREGSLREQHDFTVEKAAQRVKYFAIATPSGGDTWACHSVHASQVHALFIHVCWVTLVKLLNLSVPEFIIYKTEIMTSPTLLSARMK